MEGKLPPLVPRAPSRPRLTPREMKAINDYISANKNINHTHRRGKLLDSVRQQHETVPTLQSEELRVAPLPKNDAALYSPLCLLPPLTFRAPAILQTGDSSRLLSAVQHASHVQVKPDESKVISQSPRQRAGQLTLKDYEMRASSCRRAGKVREEAIAYYCMAVVHFNAMELEASAAAFSRAISLFEQLGDQLGLELCHNNAGLELFVSGNYQQALYHYCRHELIAPPYGQAVALINQGVCCLALGEHPTAIEKFSAALSAAQLTEDNMVHCLASGNLGLAQLFSGSANDARFNIEQCLEGCAMAGDQTGAAVCLLLLGEVFTQLKDYKHACFYYENASRVAKENGLRDLADVARVNLGIARGNVEFKQQVLSVASMLGRPPTVGELLASRYSLFGRRRSDKQLVRILIE